RGEAVPVGAVGGELRRRVGEAERGGDHVDPGQHPVLAGGELGGGGGAGGQEHLAGEVAPGGVLREGGGDDGVDLGTGQHAGASGVRSRDGTGWGAAVVPGSSSRWWAPTDPGRARAWARSRRARSRRLRSSSSRAVVSAAGSGARQVASSAAASSSAVPERSRPAWDHSSSWSSVRDQARPVAVRGGS